MSSLLGTGDLLPHCVTSYPPELSSSTKAAFNRNRADIALGSINAFLTAHDSDESVASLGESKSI